MIIKKITLRICPKCGEVTEEKRLDKGYCIKCGNIFTYLKIKTVEIPETFAVDNRQHGGI